MVPNDSAPMPMIRSLSELTDLVRERDAIYIRYSKGPKADASEESVDRESGLRLPGLSVNPLHPEGWWTRPLEDWLARQVCQYQQLQERHPERYAWVLTGTIAGRGPDCEPLLADVTALGRLSSAAVTEAADRYRSHFDAGRGPEDD